MKITRAITHIRLDDANSGKLAKLDALAAEYMTLGQQYVTHFCIEAEPHKFADFVFDSVLSARWQRVAIQQAAGIAKSWRTNKEREYNAYREEHADWVAAKEAGTLKPKQQEPVWRDWNVPNLKVTNLQANQNVVLLEPCDDSNFDYWLRISTLDKGKVLRVPVKLSAYHKRRLAGNEPNSSVTLTHRSGSWWLTLTVDEQIAYTVSKEASVIGADVGCQSFITTSTGEHYGGLDATLLKRLWHERNKRKRKAKLRSCLKKKDVAKLPSTANPKFGRHIRQSINRAVNQFFADHRDKQVAIEALSVRSMKFKARQMNAYMKASNLAHLPSQLEWGAKKRGVLLTHVKSAYTSQSCNRCYYVDKGNRPNQQAFCCLICGFATNADYNAALNIAGRLGDKELSACADRDAIKSLLRARHANRVSRLPVVQLPAQLTFEFAGVG